MPNHSILRFDPHSPGFRAANLDPEVWRTAQTDDKSLELVETIRRITEKGLAARIKSSVLQDLEIMLIFKSNTYEDNVSVLTGHFAAMALCMMTRTKCEQNNSEKMFRFSKTSFDREPSWWHNVTKVYGEGRSWDWVRKDENEVKDTRTARNREDYEVVRTPRKGSRKRDKPGQDSLFNLY